LIPLPSTEITEICKKEGLIEKNNLQNYHDMFMNPVVRTKFISRDNLKKMANKIRNYQMKKYFLEGLKMNGIGFLLDSAIFLLYYKPKYGLELDHAFRFTINKYKLKELENGGKN
jgi:hypothetical protein